MAVGRRNETARDGDGTAVGRDEAVRERALAALDLEAKVRLLSGQDFWTLPAIAEIGLDSLVMSDGPIGIRGVRWTPDDPSIALPSPTALAATWDPGLARRAGRLLGAQCRRKGIHLLLAPTVNLHRSPLGGRHFECYSEDPLLTAEIGVGYLTGVQDLGVGATVKHFVANDSETERFTADVRVSERALREIYLVPFERIVAAGVWAVMAAYNGVNGGTMTEHGGLLRDLLKDEWGFDGVVVSDWTAARSTAASANGGLDVVMPAAGDPWGAALVAAVRDGTVAEAVVDDKVRRVLRLAGRLGLLDGVPPAVDPADRPTAGNGATVAHEVATRSFVLARNGGDLLPLDAGRLSRVAVFGALADDARIQGGGSALVAPPHAISPLAGLTAALPDVEIGYAVGADPRHRLPAAGGVQWTPITATLRAADGRVLYRTELDRATVRWMGDLPDGIRPAELASIELSARYTPMTSGTHRLAIDGFGLFTLALDDAELFDGPLFDEAEEPDAVFRAPVERRFDVPVRAGEPVDVRLTRRVVDGHAGYVLFTLGHRGPVPGRGDAADAVIDAAVLAQTALDAAALDEMLLDETALDETALDEMLLDEAARVAADADVAVVVVGTTEEVESEGFDRTSLTLPGRQDDLVFRVAAANPRTVVVVNAGSPVLMPWAGEVSAILLTWFPGQEAGRALADVLLGRAEPGGRLPTTWPLRPEDCPALDTTPTDGVLDYSEGIFVGYRGWRAEPLFPFGHGLGYTDWGYRSLTVETGPDGPVAVATVQNTGRRVGREVVQVYVGPDAAEPDRPVRWLAGFAGVEAAPGESVTVRVPLPTRTFQVWGPDGWATRFGSYRIEAARSVADVRLAVGVDI
ncbi:glycoside hydrolase family 3 protein [Plantactinospora sp. S1510]|uniref:Glycoside hydrolase family 3 protein n=1 Tax=Plantactinospora alkalitolerans TaxID=2789879 RepID=A0ABS0H3P8_9ACTN|nr:glycoside hydrolase family 3 C-terminal domain-containing protein [Plantactinospora alkalitolerans]MBF9133093.1 glycoside hydrolase family 3 protein [Plantactinospora alkalitolerans]